MMKSFSHNGVKDVQVPTYKGRKREDLQRSEENYYQTKLNFGPGNSMQRKQVFFQANAFLARTMYSRQKTKGERSKIEWKLARKEGNMQAKFNLEFTIRNRKYLIGTKKIWSFYGQKTSHFQNA